jgi:topoisomerase-4 subunit A
VVSDGCLLQVLSQTDKLFEINLPDLNLLDRTSNGSFIFDEAIEGGVKSAQLK